jgi:hypothetical protein
MTGHFTAIVRQWTVQQYHDCRKNSIMNTIRSQSFSSMSTICGLQEGTLISLDRKN